MTSSRSALLLSTLLSLSACSTAPVPQAEPGKARPGREESVKRMEERHQAERRDLEEKYRGRAERSRKEQEAPAPDRLGRVIEKLEGELRGLRRDVERLQNELRKGRPQPQRGDFDGLRKLFEHGAKQFAPLILRAWSQKQQAPDRPDGKRKPFEFRQEFNPGDFRKMFEQFRNFQGPGGKGGKRFELPKDFHKQFEHFFKDEHGSREKFQRDDDDDDRKEGFQVPPEFRKLIEKHLEQFRKAPKENKSY